MGREASAASRPPAKLFIDDAVATITLDRPATFNAIDHPTAVCLEDLARQVENDARVVVLVIEGAGAGFCAGGDIDVIGADPANLEHALREMISHYHGFIESIRRMPKIVITSVHGVAAGAGFSLAFMGDICIAADDARFIPAYGRLGVSPDGGGTIGLVDAAGPQLALRIFLAEDAVSARQAFDWRLVSKIVPHEELRAETAALARRIASKGPVAIAATKALIYDSKGLNLDERLRWEEESLLACTRTSQFRAAVDAFPARRV